MVTYDVWILEFLERDPTKVVAGLVETFGIGEGSAAALASSVHSAPRAVKRGLTKEAAEQMASALRAIGARVAIEADDPDDDGVPTLGSSPASSSSSASPLTAMRRIRVGTGVSSVGRISVRPAATPTADTQYRVAPPPRTAPPPARAPQVTLAADPSDPAIELPPLLDAAALAAPLDIPDGSIPPPGPTFGSPDPPAQAPLPAFEDPSFGGLPTLAAPGAARAPTASPTTSMSMVAIATDAHDALDDAFSDPLDAPGLELELEDVPELHRSVPPSGSVALDSGSGEHHSSSSRPPARRASERPSYRASQPAPEPAWRQYKAELIYAAIGVALLLFGFARNASVFQGRAGLFGVLVDSQAMTLLVMAAWSAAKRRGAAERSAE